MRTFKIVIEPVSPFITPLHSDTLFGHLAWAILYDAGEAALKDILSRFKNGHPPFIISSAFPEGFMPVPILPPLTANEEHILYEKVKARYREMNRVIFNTTLKKLQKLEYIPSDLFNIIAHRMDTMALVDALFNHKQNGAHYEKEVVASTAINRLTGASLEDSLRNTEVTYYPPSQRFTVWLKIHEEFSVSKLESWFRIIESSGYGKRKSAGMGQFRLCGGIVDAYNELVAVENPNAFLSLSHFVPNLNDPVNGYYRYIVKRGKLGEHRALEGNIWKKPLIMFKPGSIFEIGDNLQEFNGRMVTDIHGHYTDVVHYAFAFPVGIKLSPSEPLQ